MTDDQLEEQLLACAPSMPLQNCSACTHLLVSERTRKKWPTDSRGIDVVFVVVKERPFCRPCAERLMGGAT